MLYPDADNVALELRTQLYDLFRLDRLERDSDGRSWVFTGRFERDVETAFDLVRERFDRLGYLPLFRRHGDNDVIIAAPALPVAGSPRWTVNLVLFLATLITTLMAGALQDPDLPRSVLQDPSLLLHGAPFAVALLGILGTHELGHYVAARLHGIQVTLPYFIPLPFSLLGTLGAFIRMRSPVANKKQLFDVGIAGPLAGLAIAIPVTLIGLATSPVVEARPTLTSSVVFQVLKYLAVGPLPPDHAVRLNPVAFAGWFGLWVTAINLIPAGQLDGGHIGYAVFGRAYRVVAWLAFGLIVVAGLRGGGLLLLALLIFATGVEHPPTLNDLSDLDPKRRIIGLATFLLGVLLFGGAPF
jgi:membrane-associated protease RseP (regulator of RpoE activity)